MFDDIKIARTMHDFDDDDDFDEIEEETEDQDPIPDAEHSAPSAPKETIDKKEPQQKGKRGPKPKAKKAEEEPAVPEKKSIGPKPVYDKDANNRITIKLNDEDYFALVFRAGKQKKKPAPVVLGLVKDYLSRSYQCSCGVAFTLPEDAGVPEMCPICGKNAPKRIDVK